jgi:two-component system response regulator FixJ
VKLDQFGRRLIQVSAHYAKSGSDRAFRIEASMIVSRLYRPYEQSHEPICIVDDDESVADSLKSLLETFGFDVRCYTTGADFLVDYEGRNAGCLVIDQHMPDLNGLDVVDRLQKQGVRVPIILISGRLDTNIRERASSLGVTRMIEKPFAAHQLVNLVRTALLERN